MSIEALTEILLCDDSVCKAHYGPIAVQKRYEHWASVIQELISKVTTDRFLARKTTQSLLCEQLESILLDSVPPPVEMILFVL
jgi:hypothetical protein